MAADFFAPAQRHVPDRSTSLKSRCSNPRRAIGIFRAWAARPRRLQRPARLLRRRSSGSSPTDLSVKLVKISKGRLSLNNGAKSKPRTLENVNIELRDFSAASSFPFSLAGGCRGRRLGQARGQGRSHPAGQCDRDSLRSEPDDHQSGPGWIGLRAAFLRHRRDRFAWTETRLRTATW